MENNIKFYNYQKGFCDKPLILNNYNINKNLNCKFTKNNNHKNCICPIKLLKGDSKCPECYKQIDILFDNLKISN